MMQRTIGSILVAGVLAAIVGGGAAAQDDADRRMGEDPVYSQRVELPEAGLAVTFPDDWDVDTTTDGDPDDDHRTVLFARDPDGPSCGLVLHRAPTVPLADLARLVADELVEPKPETTTAEVMAIQLPVGEAYRIDTREPQDGRGRVYLFDGGRYDLHCWTSVPGEPVWADSTDTWGYIARSIELLPGGPATEPSAEAAAYQRVAMPGAGIAVSFPADWSYERMALRQVPILLPEVEHDVWATTFLATDSEGGPACGLEMFEDMPLSRDEHAAWIEESNTRDHPGEGTFDRVPVQLPIGEAVRVDGDHAANGVWLTVYIFDSDDLRFILYCSDGERAGDDYRSIAETIEWLDRAPSLVPVDAAGWGQVEGFPRTVAVSSGEDGVTWMNAWCDRAVWVEWEDGTFEERLACSLTDDRVEPPSVQGQPPSGAFVTSGGACGWESEYWRRSDQPRVFADSWVMNIASDGTVSAVARYGAEALECAED